jgi:sugar phosphate isomerase/epimerase
LKAPGFARRKQRRHGRADGDHVKLAYMMTTPEAGTMPLCWGGDPPEHILHRVAEIGYEGIELQTRDATAFDGAALARMARGAGLAITAVSTGPTGSVDALYLMSPDPAIRERTIERFSAALCLAGEYGVHATIGNVRGFAKWAPDRKTGLGLFRDAVERLLAVSERVGAPILLEPQNRYQTDVLNTVAETLAFIDELGAPPQLIVEVDLYHMALEEKSVLAALVAARASGRTNYVQLGDSNRLAPGWGSFNWVDIIETLKATKYDGWLAMEFTQKPDSETCAKHAHAFVRPLLGDSK